MMDKNSICNYIMKLVKENEEYEDNIKDFENFMKHSIGTYEMAERIIRNIRANYPKIPIIEEEIETAAGLHDIGKVFNENPIFHELRGAKYIEEKGLGENSQKDIWRIAQMIRSHGHVYECWKHPSCFFWRKEFESDELLVKTPEVILIPRRWQEVIVTYVDLVNYKGERVKVEDRLNDVINRYKERYKNHDDIISKIIVETVSEGFDRMLNLAERVEALENGKLTERDILIFGFL
jgi:hypothetical protein